MHELQSVDVFTSGQDGFCAYRIPALAVARDGTLLAFAEARKNHRGDPGTAGNELHLVVKRSLDRGQTWSDMLTIEAPGELWSAGNPAAVCDRDTGRVWLHYLRCRPGCGSGQARPGTDDIVNLVRYSDDAGATWSAPLDICAIERFTLKAAVDDADRLVWTGPRGPGRTDLVLRVSGDEGWTFTRERLVAAGSAAYSDMERLDDGRIGVLWERDNYGFITFTPLDRTWILANG